MKKKIQSYGAFTTMPYKILALLLPVLAMALSVFMMSQEYYIIGVCVTITLILFGEIMGDFWVFGGIASAESGLPEYLRTSPAGRQLLKNAVQMHMARQLAVVLLAAGILRGIYAAGTGMSYWNQEEVLAGIVIALLGYVYIVLGSMAARCFSALHLQMVVATAAAILMGISQYILLMGVWAALAVVIVAAAAVSVASVKSVMKKEEESYYDKAD